VRSIDSIPVRCGRLRHYDIGPNSSDDARNVAPQIQVVYHSAIWVAEPVNFFNPHRCGGCVLFALAKSCEGFDTLSHIILAGLATRH
jgi:hypothetical protein